MHGFRNESLRFAIDAQHLLSDGVRPAREKARLRRSGPTLDAENAGDVDAFASEVGDQRVACGVVSDGGDRKHARAEGGEIVGGVCAAAGNETRFAVAKDQDGRFAGDAGDFAELKFVGDEIAEERNRLGRELLDVLRQSEKVDGR